MKKISLIFLILMGYFTIYAQSDGSSKLTSEEITQLSSKLAMKLLLNDAQKSNIAEVLKTYSLELTKINSGSGESNYKNKQELISALNSKINSFLDPKQKIKFAVLEKEWWISVDEEIKD